MFLLKNRSLGIETTITRSLTQSYQIYTANHWTLKPTFTSWYLDPWLCNKLITM